MAPSLQYQVKLSINVEDIVDSEGFLSCYLRLEFPAMKTADLPDYTLVRIAQICLPLFKYCF